VWIFFTDVVPAVRARAVGTALLHEAMVLRGSMDLRSYDRLFPNQDVLPDGGFGNLIAAPLHGRRRKDGLTTFLDLGTLEPHDDQWAFLSTLDRLTPGDAERVAQKAKRSTTGVDVATISRSAATRVRPALPPLVHAEIGAGLRIETAQLTPAALATFKHAAAMANAGGYTRCSRPPSPSAWSASSRGRRLLARSPVYLSYLDEGFNLGGSADRWPWQFRESSAQTLLRTLMQPAEVAEPAGRGLERLRVRDVSEPAVT
jgi:hypothetical protein